MRTINYNLLSVQMKSCFSKNAGRITFQAFREFCTKILSRQETVNLFNCLKANDLLISVERNKYSLNTPLNTFGPDFVRDMFLTNDIQLFSGRAAKNYGKKVSFVKETTVVKEVTSDLSKFKLEDLIFEINKRGFGVKIWKS